MLSNVNVLAPKWASDESAKLQKKKDILDNAKFLLAKNGSTYDTCETYRGVQELWEQVGKEQAKLNKRIREIKMHGAINERAAQ